MPRDLSGNYSRVNPPGAAGYQFNTDIDQNQVNAELNDLGAEITDSLSASGKKTATANLPMGGFVHSGLGMADADGETLRFQALKKGSDIAVIANGTVAIPAEGALFNLTAASAFNVTGLTGGYDGRTYSVRFNPDKLLTLVNSSTFKLLGGASRITRAGEILRFTQESSGVIAEIGTQPIIDMTGYTGADIALGINQAVIYDESAITTKLLRIATGDNQLYELRILPTNTAAATFATPTNLQPNNANTGAGAVTRSTINTAQGASPVASGAFVSENNFVLDNANTVYKIHAEICTRTNGKTVEAQSINASATANTVTVTHGRWSDTTTAWSSLGTLNFGAAITGRIMVRRLM